MWFTYNKVGYPRGNGMWPPNRVWPLNRGWCTLQHTLFFHYRVITFLVNMESIQENHDRRVFELSLVTLVCHRPFQNKVFKFWVAA